MDHKRAVRNAKARQSTGGQRKKGRKHTKSDASATTEHDPNAVIIVPKSEEQKERDRRERLRQELISQSESKINSKKKKRLEKYIEKKLKQEERVVLFEKLSKTQAQLPNALSLASSATLGTGRAITHKELVEREEHHEVKRTMHGRSHAGKRKRSALTYDSPVDEYASDDAREDSEKDFDGAMAVESREPESTPGSSRANPVVLVDSGFSTKVEVPTPVTTMVGSALQRNADGTVVAPRVVKKKKKTISTFTSWKVRTAPSDANDEASDTSFDSSDSAYDTDEDAEDSDDDNASDGDESGGSKGEEGDEDTPEQAAPPTKKKLGFKDWAMKQLSAAKGYVAPVDPDPSSLASAVDAASPPPKKRKVESSEPQVMRGPLGKDIALPETALAKHLQEHSADAVRQQKRYVDVQRPSDVEAARLLLPIVAEEQPIMEAILLNNVVIICGETGSGKTTQVPQFLYEAGFGTSGSGMWKSSGVRPQC
ncbi:hypothetical protein NM688_g2004 [Phlebia brevispora]|uniref:Uncharacterized protein n=1 Tax=Phlebia brevispora TaxID=194682 RepID=A0ACC1T9H4_9APHY|nr:hypothetical protein NM688_g2004 [Phlebia brevispora]